MGGYKIELRKQAIDDLNYHAKVGDKATINKINQILVELEIHPYTGTAKPESLKGNLKGYWSRRINHKDRIIYKVIENIITVIVVSALGHYDDK
jgi:toxin YoeB